MCKSKIIIKNKRYQPTKKTDIQKKPIELKIEQTNKEITDLEKSLKTQNVAYRDWETDRKSTRLNSSHSAKSRMPSSA